MNALIQPTASVTSSLNINLTDFIDEFGDELLESLNRSNPPVYTGNMNEQRQAVLANLKRTPFPAQAEVVQAITALLLDRNEQAAIINAEMGTGKTMMAIAVAAVMHAAGYRRTLVISPPHLVYKWRREILETTPDARVWVLNGPDTLVKLLKLRDQSRQTYDGRPEFFILGRVRMRMGFHWRLACWKRRATGGQLLAACPDCGQVLEDLEGNLVTVDEFERGDRRRNCTACNAALWTLMRPGKADGGDRRSTILKSMCRIPTIGPVRAERLLNDFGEDFLASMLVDNVSEFINLMDAKGNFVFNDRQAKRMERAMANIEFGFGEGGYQPTEFIKRYLPDGFFDLLVVDEGHEYKNSGSAQGQAMGVLAAKARKSVLLTGTLMGGYAIDVPMAPEQASAYQRLAATLTAELRQALARRDTTLLGVVLNVLLAWPDCCFRSEMVKHPRTRDTLAFVPALFGDDGLMPKEQALLNLCLEEKAKGRKVLAYTVYSGTRDTTSRLKKVLEQAGLRVAVLRATVETARREDWILDQVDRGIDVLLTNPELVKTGLDLLDFPTIVFLQTGYNVYTLQQAARRSWRIGQKHPVRVIFFGYAGSSQITCLQLMAKKIAVAQSTSGDVPESGLDSLNQDGDSVEMALARQLIAA